MSRYYPVFFDLEGRLAVVVGEGDAVSARTDAFLEAGARVRVVCLRPDRHVRDLAQTGRVELRHRGYEVGDLEGASLALVVADGQEELVRDEADGMHVPLCVVDRLALCDWIHGSVIRRGQLVVAISTSGVAPALAVRLRERLANELGPEYAWFLEIAAQHRRRIAASSLSFAARRALWYRMVDASLEAFRDGHGERVRASLEDALEHMVQEATGRVALAG